MGVQKVYLLNQNTPVIIPSGLVPKGAYNALTDYTVGDSVDYNGSSYVMHVDAVAGTLPTDTTKWQVLANKGNTGATGTTGATGATGATGSAGSNGTNGTDGADGASITSAAFSTNDIVFTKDDATTVTLTNAAITLKGDTGLTGAAGATGATGATGPAGADGAFAGRTITGTTNQITVTNGDGVSGNPTLSLPQSIATTSSPTFGGLKVDETMYKSKEFIASTIITFVADDGLATDFTLLKPLFDSYGYKFTTAVIANNIGTAGYTSSSQIQQLYAEGHEIASHALTHTYPGLGSLTEAEQLVEIRDSQAAINNLGVDCNNIVYPFGSANHITKELSRRYYRSGRRFHHVGLNPMPLHTFDLRTISLGAWFETPNATYPVTDTYIDYYKPWVDAAVASKQWLIFTLHSGAVSFDATQQGYLVDTLNYIQSLGIPVKTLDQALDHFGNLVDVERYNTSGTSSRFAVGADGSTINTGDSSAIGRVGIGVEPSSPLHIASNGPASTVRDVFIDRYKTDDVAPYINGRKARGTIDAPLAIIANDNILGLFAGGHDGTAFGANTAAMKFSAAENFTSIAQGTYMTFGTTPIGALSRVTRLKIDHDGQAIFTASSALSTGNAKALSITPTVLHTGTSGHTTLYVNPTITTAGSGPNILMDIGANAESYIMAKYGAASSLTGGRGWLNITNPSADAAGAGIIFSSTSTPYIGLFQLDNTGNMVFRNRGNTSANIYIDTATDVIFRTGTTSATTILTLKANGNLQLLDASSIVIGTTTGTKIGTATNQKLAFYNSTPIIQPTGSIVTALSNLGLVATPTIAQADVTNLVSDLALKAPLASPTFTGLVTAVGLAISGSSINNSLTSGSLRIFGGTADNGGGFIITGSTNGFPNRGIIKMSTTSIAQWTSTGLYVGAGVDPTAALDIDPSTTARSGLRLRSGVAPTTPNNGDIWFDGTDIKVRVAGVTKTVTLT